MKIRHSKKLSFVELLEFDWIKSVTKKENSMMPSSKETYIIKFESQCFPTERRRLEKYIYQFYEVEKGRHQVMICWMERGAEVIVF